MTTWLLGDGHGLFKAVVIVSMFVLAAIVAIYEWLAGRPIDVSRTEAERLGLATETSPAKPSRQGIAVLVVLLAGLLVGLLLFVHLPRGVYVALWIAFGALVLTMQSGLRRYAWRRRHG